jgi:hypothetical protein
MSTQINTLDEKFHTLTDKYKLAKTSDMIHRIEGLGFKLINFVAMKTRKKERQGFQKHRAMFTSPLLKETQDGIPQLLLTNSHDGTSSVVLQLGFFRLICSNGLVVGSNVVEPIRIKHSGNDFEDRLIAGINNIVAQAEKVSQSIDKLKARVLSDAEIKAFQREAVEWRLKDKLSENGKIEDFTFPTYRTEDTAQDLFTVMNVVQENLIRGGAKVLIDKNGDKKLQAVRRVNSINTQMEINTTLWEMAERMVA